MATFAQRASYLDDATFIARTQVAITEAAVAVANEDPTAANHLERRKLAKLVLLQPEDWAHRFAASVANNANVGTGSSDPAADTAEGDGALAFVVASLWDAYAV